MTTKTRQTGKQTPAAPKRQTPALDLSALTVADATLPKGSRAGGTANSPFPNWLRESQESGSGKSVTVPAANVARITYLIRAAASDLNIGSRVVYRDTNGTVLDVAAVKALPSNASVEVMFTAKNRKQRKQDANA